jgi:translation initiation factor RLI1
VPQKIAMVDYRTCQPENCSEGICLAALACPNKILRQEAPYEIPDSNQAMCIGCGVCIPACPQEAIRLI